MAFALARRFASSVFLPPSAKAIPVQRGAIQTPHGFLKAIGRDAETKLKLPEDTSWDSFFQMKSRAMKVAGVNVQDRRYILWAMQQFRMGREVEDFASKPKPKKKVRGWGPAVQNGKLLRSRRHRLPKKIQLEMTMHKLPQPGTKASTSSTSSPTRR